VDSGGLVVLCESTGPPGAFIYAGVQRERGEREEGEIGEREGITNTETNSLSSQNRNTPHHQRERERDCKINVFLALWELDGRRKHLLNNVFMTGIHDIKRELYCSCFT